MERETHAIFYMSRTKRKNQKKRVSPVGGRELNF
jgi:hypothetical protein